MVGTMTMTYLVAIDLAKRHFQVCTDFSGKVLFNRNFLLSAGAIR